MIYLSCPIYSFNSTKEIAVISMLSNNIQYEMTEPLKLKLIGGDEKQVLNKTYTSRELSVLVEGKIILKPSFHMIVYDHWDRCDR